MPVFLTQSLPIDRSGFIGDEDLKFAEKFALIADVRIEGVSAYHERFETETTGCFLSGFLDLLGSDGTGLGSE